MKLSQAKLYLPFVQAAAEGKTIQSLWCSRNWKDIDPDSNLHFSRDPSCYRVKPSLTLRPWKSNEVQVGAVMQNKGEPHTRALILGMDGDNLLWAGYNGNILKNPLSRCCENCEYSTDFGKTWHPCGVVEE